MSFLSFFVWFGYAYKRIGKRAVLNRNHSWRCNGILYFCESKNKLTFSLSLLWDSRSVSRVKEEEERGGEGER
jgi:hypothetical protein